MFEMFLCLDFESTSIIGRTISQPGLVEVNLARLLVNQKDIAMKAGV